MEVWPVSVKDPREHEGNGHERTQGLLYELAELDFTSLARGVSLEHFHFSQLRSVFEIGWREFGHNLELRVHVAPAETDDDALTAEPEDLL